ncbi:hypothetical protein H4217_009113, partial [Coemansia sp. RSA 1939]
MPTAYKNNVENNLKRRLDKFLDLKSEHISRYRKRTLNDNDTSDNRENGNGEEVIPYLDDLPREVLASLPRPLVALDPGKRQLLCGTSDNSTPDVPIIFRYTDGQRNARMRIKVNSGTLERVKPKVVKDAEARLSVVSHLALDPLRFATYITVRAAEWRLLADFYADTQTEELPEKREKRLQIRERRDAQWKQRNRSVFLQDKLGLGRLNQQKQQENRAYQQEKQWNAQQRLKRIRLNGQHERQRHQQQLLHQSQQRQLAREQNQEHPSQGQRRSLRRQHQQPRNRLLWQQTQEQQQMETRQRNRLHEHAQERMPPPLSGDLERQRRAEQQQQQQQEFRRQQGDEYWRQHRQQYNRDRRQQREQRRAYQDLQHEQGR